MVPFYEVKEEGGAVQQGPLKMVAVMRRDSSQRELGGWRWAAFDGAGKPLPVDAKTGGFQCHEGQRDREYVFTQWTEP